MHDIATVCEAWDVLQRHGIRPDLRVDPFPIARALLRLEEQRDALLAACDAILACPHQLDETLHGYLRVDVDNINGTTALIRAAVAKARGVQET